MTQVTEDSHRWNIERDGNDLLICDGQHEKTTPCEYVRYTRTPSPASPSPVAEGQAVATVPDGWSITRIFKTGVEIIPPRDLRGLPLKMTMWPCQFRMSDTLVLFALADDLVKAAALSSQAPKPASAGGEYVLIPREPTDAIEARGVVTVPRKAYETVCAALGHISVGGIDNPRDYASRALHRAAELEAAALRARESAPAVERDGWVLVPMRATVAMCDEFEQIVGGLTDSTMFGKAWRAAIAAAPSPPSVATGCAGEVTVAGNDVLALLMRAQSRMARDLVVAGKPCEENEELCLIREAIDILEAALSQPARVAGET